MCLALMRHRVLYSGLNRMWTINLFSNSEISEV